METSFAMMATCGTVAIERKAKALEATFAKAPKQFEAYKSALLDTLDDFEPGKALAKATAHTDFDMGRLRKKVWTVYIVLPADKIESAASWVRRSTGCALVWRTGSGFSQLQLATSMTARRVAVECS